MQKFVTNSITNSEYSDILFIDENNKLNINIEIEINDSVYGNSHLVNIQGTFENGPFKCPNLRWDKTMESRNKNKSTNVLSMPSRVSYHAGGEYSNNVGRWLDSTLIENTTENLLYAYHLAKKYNVLHLISESNWDELFYLRSYFTQDGKWIPIKKIVTNIDYFIRSLIGEVKFFSDLKTAIFIEKKFLSSLNNHRKLTPIQVHFLIEENVMIIFKLIEYFSNFNNFDLALFDLIINYLPNIDIKYQLWKSGIIQWKNSKKDLIEHFQEFNKIRYLLHYQKL